MILGLFAHSVEKTEVEGLVEAGVEVATVGKGAYGKAHLYADTEVMLTGQT